MKIIIDFILMLCARSKQRQWQWLGTYACDAEGQITNINRKEI
jgi:hypothetical protein